MANIIGAECGHCVFRCHKINSAIAVQQIFVSSMVRILQVGIHLLLAPKFCWHLWFSITWQITRSFMTSWYWRGTSQVQLCPWTTRNHCVTLVPHTTVRYILFQHLHLKPNKHAIAQQTINSDKVGCQEFCSEILDLIGNEETFLENTIFSNKSPTAVLVKIHIHLVEHVCDSSKVNWSWHFVYGSFLL